MTPEEKRLLLKDLGARLLYGTNVSVTDGTVKYNAYIESISYRNIQVSPISDSIFTGNAFYKISEIKPYLRPMSSMTEEERYEFDSYHSMFNNDPVGLIDWLNSHHFDYRNLIEKKLALEAPEGMYNLNNFDL